LIIFAALPEPIAGLELFCNFLILVPIPSGRRTPNWNFFAIFSFWFQFPAEEELRIGTFLQFSHFGSNSQRKKSSELELFCIFLILVPITTGKTKV